MKYDDMLAILDSVSDEHIFECAPPLNVKRKNGFIARLGIATACLIVVTVSAWLIPKAVKEPSALPFADNDSTTADTERIFPAETATSTQGKDTENTPQSNTTETPTQVTTEPKPEEPVYVDGLQVISAKFSTVGGAGFEAYLVKDTADLDKGNPWDPSRPIAALPVYKYLAYNPDMHGGPTVYLSHSEMLEIAKEAAAEIGEDILDYTEISYVDQKMTDTTGMENAESPVCLWAYTEATWILVSSTGGYSYRFTDTRGEDYYKYDSPPFTFEYTDNENSLKNRIKLPSGIKLDGNPTSEDILDVFRYVFENHSRFVFADCFEARKTITSYTFEGNVLYRSNSYSVYETFPDDYLRTLMSYYFNTATITVSEDGGFIDAITPFRNNFALRTEKLGDYPIITDEDALELLICGKYISSVPAAELKNGEINASDVHKCELIYVTDKYVIPYYKFYVELNYDSDTALSNGSDPSLKLYGAFYVPAVEVKYLAP